MIKYVVIPESKKTMAILENTKYDAQYRINKMLKDTGFCFIPSAKYLMPNKFVATTVCNDVDVYDVEEGKRIAKQKLLNHYHASIDKRVKMFKDELSTLCDTLTN
jgi:hypothetical protein